MRQFRASFATIAAGLLLTMGLTLGACEDEGPAEKAGKQVDQAVQDTKDGLDKAKENTTRMLNEAEQKVKDAPKN